MSTAEEPHPIVAMLSSIEQRLGNIEKALGIKDKPKPLLRKRTIALIVVLVVFALGTLLGINYVFDKFFAALPM